MNRLDQQKRAQILHLLGEGPSIRAVTRVTGASKNTVTKLLTAAGKACMAYHDEKVRLTKYFGLVPRFLLEQAQPMEEGEEVVNLFGEEGSEEDDWDLVEAIVVIANEGTLLKAEASPYMMEDRPIIAFSWDTVPGLFWGRGVCEKGYNSQKALDAEIRARIDALAITVHPMLAMDATRIPRGHKPKIAPGKMILTNGNPSEVLQPFNFGQVSQIFFG